MARFVAIRASMLLAINYLSLNPLESPVDEVIKKNLDAHRDGSPDVVLNVSEPVAARIRELAGVAEETVDAVPETAKVQESPAETVSVETVAEPVKVQEAAAEVVSEETVAEPAKVEESPAETVSEETVAEPVESAEPAESAAPARKAKK